MKRAVQVMLLMAMIGGIGDVSMNRLAIFREHKIEHLRQKRARVVNQLFADALAIAKDPAFRKVVLWVKNSKIVQVVPVFHGDEDILPARTRASHGQVAGCLDPHNYNILLTYPERFSRPMLASIFGHECVHAYRMVPHRERFYKYVDGYGGAEEELIAYTIQNHNSLLYYGKKYRIILVKSVNYLYRTYQHKHQAFGEGPYPRLPKQAYEDICKLGEPPKSKWEKWGRYSDLSIQAFCNLVNLFAKGDAAHKKELKLTYMVVYNSHFRAQ